MKEAMLYDKKDKMLVCCNLCGHRCKIPESSYGLCNVRQNIRGVLYSHVYGRVIAQHTDPIEKKPLYHFLPGSASYSIATVGCNFRCGFCQNWNISQVLANDKEYESGSDLLPDDVVKAAKKNKCASISYTYTEPTIFFEYAYDIAKIAKQSGLRNAFVTNGYMTLEAIDTIRPFLDAANVDLKFFKDESYKKICNGSLEPVLESIRHMKRSGIWVEITTLLIPGLNDSEEELKGIAGFIADIGVDIPWHISRFHPDYKFLDLDVTPLEAMRRAERIGRERGLRYVYLGNVVEGNDTLCHKCGNLIVSRGYMYVSGVNLDGNKCPKCKTVVDGVFN